MSNLKSLINKVISYFKNKRKQPMTEENELEYLPQNASGLYLDLQKIGCFFRAACHMAEMKAGRALTLDQLNGLWDLAKTYKYINANLDVQQSAPIANLALKVLKARGKFVEVATFQNGQTNYYKSIPQDQRRCDFYIQKILQGGPSKTHFININNLGEIIWDPHDPAIKRISAYYTICYRFDEDTK